MASFIYFCSIASTIKGLMSVFMVLSLVSAFVLGMAYDEVSSEFNKKAKCWLKIAVVCFVVSLLGSILVPKTEVLMAMYGVPAIIENKKVMDMSDKAVRILDKQMDRMLEGDK